MFAALRPIEHALLPEAVRLFARGALAIDPADPRHPLVGDAPPATDRPDSPADRPGESRAGRADDVGEG